ncbi:MAG: tRNA uridine(34) 5-carboxymethylaminomethyl modification radical SAM/GNAT enzyme Elp3, partial [Thermoproteota archaeon]|nr:tRNA uridine(34) 5-carboxymethylaminomethyl modification radical SAM/GNAT enzyme Elp3 [Thermoproteota archaeon]
MFKSTTTGNRKFSLKPDSRFFNDTKESTGKDEDPQYLMSCKEIAKAVLESEKSSRNVITIKSIFKTIKSKSSELNLKKIPKNSDILRFLPSESRCKKLLKSKPSKTSSGIAVITVLPMPFECPHGKCIYCPGGIEVNTPLSYVGTEPATRIAQDLNYDPFSQVTSKLHHLNQRGHPIEKAELVIVGGTFPFYPKTYQYNFVKGCFDAFNCWGTVTKKNQQQQQEGPFLQKPSKDTEIQDYVTYNRTFTKDIGKNSSKSSNAVDTSSVFRESLETSKKLNEKSTIRCVGLTIETKPDYCKKEHVDTMLELGATRIEIGVQALSERVYKAVNRGHSLSDVYDAFQIAKDCGYKIVAHMMPGLPKSSLEEDVNDFKTLFEDERLKPDMIKIYPTLVLKNTGLYKMYTEKKYNPYSTEDLVKILVEMKKIIPYWARIMRIQREIEPTNIVAGPRLGNLRQMVSRELAKQGISCRCIRCREIGLINPHKPFSVSKDIILHRDEYYSSHGKEIFLSFETKDRKIIFGFLRLRILSNPMRKE